MYKGGQRQAISESKDSFQVDNGGLLNYPTALNLWVESSFSLVVCN